MRSHSQDLRPSMQRRMWMNAEHPWETQSLVTIIATTTWAATTAPAEWATFCTRTSIPAQVRREGHPICTRLLQLPKQELFCPGGPGSSVPSNAISMSNSSSPCPPTLPPMVYFDPLSLLLEPLVPPANCLFLLGGS
ncbi:mannan-binding lectin serine peptidase 2, isoform CRA_e [Rattus norvegicus]|uniref:Mannan-binding lectin serine peptidase 2, isoform CRA_e n=1 Tax=Rattus norvegicus TaxID=10116 RepID=A6IU78_RAT|nr:mannan-binding lectin serine peptidase 2, isoform CRA_e [Rattus norvegicus]